MESLLIVLWIGMHRDVLVEVSHFEKHELRKNPYPVTTGTGFVSVVGVNFRKNPIAGERRRVLPDGRRRAVRDFWCLCRRWISCLDTASSYNVAMDVSM